MHRFEWRNFVFKFCHCGELVWDDSRVCLLLFPPFDSKNQQLNHFDSWFFHQFFMFDDGEDNQTPGTNCKNTFWNVLSVYKLEKHKIRSFTSIWWRQEFSLFVPSPYRLEVCKNVLLGMIDFPKKVGSMVAYFFSVLLTMLQKCH